MSKSFVLFNTQNVTIFWGNSPENPSNYDIISLDLLHVFIHTQWVCALLCGIIHALTNLNSCGVLCSMLDLIAHFYMFSISSKCLTFDTWLQNVGQNVYLIGMNGNPIFFSFSANWHYRICQIGRNKPQLVTTLK